MPSQQLQNSSTGILSVRATRINFLFIALFAGSIIIFDAGNLITRDMVGLRWSLAAVLLVVNTAVWYLARRMPNVVLQKILVWLLLISQIACAGLMTYWERGMASMSTILYALPIVTAGILLSRTATLATALLCLATYAFSAMKYFNDFFNEGYKLQLYGQIVFFGGAFMVIAWIVNVINGESKR